MEALDFVNRANADYVDRLYQQYKQDPRLVEPQWQAFFQGFEVGNGRTAPTVSVQHQKAAGDSGLLAIEIADLVHSYRELGHFVAKLDPLGHHRPNHPLLDLSEFHLSDADLDRQVGRDGFLTQTDGTLRDLVQKLRTTYCDTIGAEFMFISDKAQREWLLQRMEPTLNHPRFSDAEKLDTLGQIVCAQ